MEFRRVLFRSRDEGRPDHFDLASGGSNKGLVSPDYSPSFDVHAATAAMLAAGRPASRLRCPASWTIRARGPGCAARGLPVAPEGLPSVARRIGRPSTF